MVQRTVPNKLPLHADHDKSEELMLGSLKPSKVAHREDGKNRGSDLKKKMKKSGFLKLSKEGTQHGNPLLPDVQNGAAPPKKQYPAKAKRDSPNYMKPTSSFDAKKDHWQVSSQICHTASDRSPRRKNSNNSKHGSKKFVRTLTKTPSFKQARASSKLRSPAVALCENLNVQRSTCSSTLKDSKLPPYLELNPGGTELEGTSVMRVCTYTYCSLNGYHHPPLPPLKTILTKTRRQLQNQKSLRSGCPSPRQSNPFVEDGDAGMMTIDVENPNQSLDLVNSAVISSVNKECIDYSIEIYTNDSTFDTDKIISYVQNGANYDSVETSANVVMSASNANHQTRVQNDDDQQAESILDEPPFSDIDFPDDLNQRDDLLSVEMSMPYYFLKDQTTKESEVYSPALAEDKHLTDQCNMEVESTSSFQQEELNCEGSDMEWEAEEYFSSYPEDGDRSSTTTDSEYNLERGSWNFKDHTSHDEHLIFKSDDAVGSHREEFFVDEFQEYFHEKNANSKTWIINKASQSHDFFQLLATDSSVQVPIVQITDAFSETKTTEETDADNEVDSNVIGTVPLYPREDPTKKEKEINDEESRVNITGAKIGQKSFQVEIDRSNAHIKDEDQLDHQNIEYLQTIDKTTSLSKQGSDNFRDSIATDEYSEMGNSESQNKNAIYQLKELIESNLFPYETSDGSSLPSAEESEADENFVPHEILTRIEVRNIQVDAVGPWAGPETGNLLQEVAKDRQNYNDENNRERELIAVANNAEIKKIFTCEAHSMKKQNDSIGKQSHMHVVDQSTKVEGKDIGSKGVPIIGRECITKMNIEDGTPAVDPLYTGSKGASIYAHRNPNQGVANKFKNSRYGIRSKRPIEEWDGQKEFNPREPNYLPVELGPEVELVDLRHQTIDERKNSEEWMLDYALRQAVAKLGPARKKKVSLLVEAFEMVIPAPNYKAHLKHASTAFTQTRIIPACS